MRVTEAKSFDISKREVWEAYKRVKAKRGAAGGDGVTIAMFEQDLSKNLYRIWNRMASGSYLPPPVKRVDIPKGEQGSRWNPTLERMHKWSCCAARAVLEPVSALAYGVGTLRDAQCWQYDWVVEFDIKGAFDNLDHGLLMKAVRKHTDCRWVVLYVERWLKADVLMPDGTLMTRDKGTPQGGVVSPTLANLFLHYAFDQWMVRHHPKVPFERYADDIICHCDSQAEAESLRMELQERLAACQLELHPEKTRVVYCADANRRGEHDVRRFDFLGYTFKPRQAMNRRGRLFTSFSPAVGDKAGKAMRHEIRGWGLQRLNRYDLDELLARIRPVLVGWVRYYGLFHPSSLQRALKPLDHDLVRWAQRKYKKLRGRYMRAWDWLRALRHRAPTYFPHWSAAMMMIER